MCNYIITVITLHADCLDVLQRIVYDTLTFFSRLPTHINVRSTGKTKAKFSKVSISKWPIDVFDEKLTK